MTAAMRRIATWTIIGALVGCSGKTEQAKPADQAGKQAPAVAPAPADAAPAVAAVPDAAPPPFLPPTLDEKSGIIFAARAGGTVKGMKDGTPVAVVGESGGAVGDMADATVTVEHEGKKLKLIADRVLRSGTVDALQRSPDSAYAVFAPIVACGDMCHSVIWLITARDGKRLELGEGGPTVHVAWHPKGGTVAVGSGTLWIVSLADYKVKHLEDYRSPSYSPDGTLYARGDDGSAYTVGKGKPVKVWDAAGSGEAFDPNDEEMAGEEPRPVEFENGKPSFDLDWLPD